MDPSGERPKFQGQFVDQGSLHHAEQVKKEQVLYPVFGDGPHIVLGHVPGGEHLRQGALLVHDGRRFDGVLTQEVDQQNDDRKDRLLELFCGSCVSLICFLKSTADHRSTTSNKITNIFQFNGIPHAFPHHTNPILSR